MIFPYLKGIALPLKAPFTYFLLLLNIFVFVVTDADRFDSDRAESIYSDDAIVRTQGQLFSQMILARPEKFSPLLVHLADRVRAGDRDISLDHDAAFLMGSLALRNTDFMQGAQAFQFDGDQVAIENWRQEFARIEKLQDENPSYVWGLNSRHSGWQNWVTYQFSHGGFAHLFWNMLFLMIMGSFVETTLGGSLVAITYLLAGFAGALSYSYLAGISFLPLVGASASVSGLTGLILFSQRRERVVYFYWLLPIPGYFGFARLPAALLALIFIIPDITGYLSNVGDFGSMVAYSAHVGGWLCGALIGVALHYGLLVNEFDTAAAPPPGSTPAH